MAEEETKIPGDENFIRWLLVAFVVAILLGLGVFSLYYDSRSASHDVACAHAESRCDGL